MQCSMHGMDGESSAVRLKQTRNDPLQAAKTAALEDAVQLPPGSEPPSVPRSLTLSAGDRCAHTPSPREPG